jgi:heat shock protein HslJ
MRYAAAFALLLGATACTASGTGGDIEGTWLYQSYTNGGETISVEVDVNASSEPYVVLEGSEISGESGCNSFGGSFDYDEGSLKTHDVFSTLAACLPESLMEAESAFYDLISGGAAVAVSVDGDTMRWQRGEAMLTFTHTDEPPPTPTIPPQTSFRDLDCGEDEVVTEDVSSEGTTAEEVAYEADDRVTDVTVEGEVGQFATGYDPEGNVLVVVAFQDVDPFPYRIFACP